MYLNGSKWSMLKRKRRSNPWRVLILIVLVAGAIYLNQVVVPQTPPLFVPTPTATRSPESYTTDAQTLEGEGKYTLAIQSYKQATQVDPKNPSNYIALTRLLIYTKELDEAETTIRNALLLNPNNSMSNALLGWIQGLRGDYVEAEATFKRALAQDPSNAVAYAYQAEIYAYQSQSSQATLTTVQNAIDASRMAQQLNSNLMETHRARGLVLEYTKNFAEAANEFKAAVALNPNLPDLHLALGRSYYSLDYYDLAIEEFTKANTLYPSDSLPDTWIASTYLKAGYIPKAIQWAETALVDSPADPYMYGNLGTYLYRNSETDNAIEMMRYAIKGGTTPEGVVVKGLPLDYGKVAGFYAIYGLMLARSGQCTEAIQIAQAIIANLPNDLDNVYNANVMIETCSNAPTPNPASTPPAASATDQPED